MAPLQHTTASLISTWVYHKNLIFTLRKFDAVAPALDVIYEKNA